MRDAPTPPLPAVRLTARAADTLMEWSTGQRTRPYGTPDGPSRPPAEAPLPDEVAQAVTRFGAQLGAAGALLVSGLPVPADLPATPDRPYPLIRRSVGTEPLLQAVADPVGEIFGYADWHDGDRVQNLYPLPEQARGQNASNSVRLEMHTETAFRPDTPDALALYCLRGDPRAQTVLCDLARVCAGLPAAQAEALAEPAYGFALPDGTLTAPLPVIGRWRDRPRYHYADALVPHDAAHAGPLEALRTAVRETATRIVLRAGDLLLLDNVHMVHGRTAYRPRYDGTDRWLQRCLVHAPATAGPLG
ncbi:TauD/TfdA family dioxygenase [Streptomyces sp. NPDC090106]|uniref:TauD/TfdA family dioxygenase n=1 Tax=Streptomyces sp. NPDC090106 TaxID=3365946 RepID=UPI0037FF64F8